ncbi:MAG: hypothetical protein Q4D88_00165 [Anaerococcus sp.]|nr:hypothetical protein [Anaerococcus sp.]
MFTIGLILILMVIFGGGMLKFIGKLGLSLIGIVLAVIFLPLILIFGIFVIPLGVFGGIIGIIGGLIGLLVNALPIIVIGLIGYLIYKHVRKDYEIW